MTYSDTAAPIAELKDQAKRLRSRLRGTGVQISHSEALEMIAHQHGARDWNTLRARSTNGLPLAVGDRVHGRYLNQPFTGYVKGLVQLGQGGQQRITLHFDEPVDVVTFDSFSSFRQRVSGVIDKDGQSPRKTSDGVAQLTIDGPAP